MVNRCTGNKQGDGEGHGCYHTNFDISENYSELCSKDRSQIGGPGPGGGKAGSNSIQIAVRMEPNETRPQMVNERASRILSSLYRANSHEN